MIPFKYPAQSVVDVNCKAPKSGAASLTLGDVRIGNRIKGMVRVVGERKVWSQEDPIERSDPDPLMVEIAQNMRQSAKDVKALMALRATWKTRTMPRLVRPGGERVPLRPELPPTFAALAAEPRKDIEPERERPTATGYDPTSKLSANYTARPAVSYKFWEGGYGARRR